MDSIKLKQAKQMVDDANSLLMDAEGVVLEFSKINNLKRKSDSLGKIRESIDSSEGAAETLESEMKWTDEDWLPAEDKTYYFEYVKDGKKVRETGLNIDKVRQLMSDHWDDPDGTVITGEEK
tara:strand:- start:808 stop:1173 length:366 start_codon:yes stop_codon:yes gene_type:complete